MVEPIAPNREDMYYTLFNHYLDASLIVDYISGEIVASNSAARRYLRYPQDKLTGRCLYDLVPREQFNEVQEFMEQLRMFGHALVTWNLSLGTGELAKSQLNAASFSYERGQQVIVTIRPDGDEVGASEATEQIQRLRTQVDEMRRRNYELNNPLQELISRIELHGEQHYRHAVERITAVIRDLRVREGRPEAGKTTLSKPRTVLKNDRRQPCTQNRVLIVDDDVSIRNLFYNVLQMGLPKVSLEMAMDGPEAIQAFERSHHEVVIMDVNMPKMSGERVLHSMEEHCRLNYWRMPTVILCTGYDPGDTLARMKSQDEEHTCLLKPVSNRQLLTLVQERLTLSA